MVDDNDEDIYLMKRAFNKLRSTVHFMHSNSADDLFDCLYKRNKHANEKYTPHLILLDINMPVHSGFDVLNMLKTNKDFKHIPISMLSTSSNATEVKKAYGLGASSFLEKPTNAEGTNSLIEGLCDYWFTVACLPES